MTSPKAGASMQAGLLQTFELHKDKGPITNLICIHRPLTLFGLTANMKAYEPVEMKPFLKVPCMLDAENATTQVSLVLGDYQSQATISLWDKISEYEEIDYIIRSS